MWERPDELWRRLKLGREEMLQRLMTTLIVGGDPPPWNTPCSPSEEGYRFLRLLDGLAHDEAPIQASTHEVTFVDEYLLPKLEADADNGWPDWAFLMPGRVWIIELKTETGSHRDAQLPYYLRLASAAHPDCRVDLTYITGPLTTPAPALAAGQRYSHLNWEQVLQLVDAVWGDEPRPEVAAYVKTVRAVVKNLAVLRPSEQRAHVIGLLSGAADSSPVSDPESTPVPPNPVASPTPRGAGHPTDAAHLLDLAQSTAADGRQRTVGAGNPTDLEALRDEAREAIDNLPADDRSRFVLPWLWHVDRSGGEALTSEGAEFGYELRFSRYEKVQIKP